MRDIYKNKKIAAIIPARKGSKGIPNKNIVLLDGIPLIEHTIRQTKKVEIIDKIIISTDSEEICNIAKKYDVEPNNLRPMELSNDSSIIYDVLKYEIKNYNLVEEGFEILILLQPTSPLRQDYMIENALKDFVDYQQKSAVSVSEVEEHPIFMRTIDKHNKLNKVLKVNSTVRRQDLSKYYKVNGMIYINKVHDIINEYVSLNDNVSPIIVPKQFAIDIDTLDDLKMAQEKLDRFTNK